MIIFQRQAQLKFFFEFMLFVQINDCFVRLFLYVILDRIFLENILTEPNVQYDE